MSRNLLILSAEIISEDLQLYFGKLPSAMVPFKDKLAIDYIYHENKNHYKKIYIVVYKNADLIINHINYKQYDIQIIKLPQLGDLSYSLSYSLQQIEDASELTLIFGDTYVPYMSSFISNNNVLMYAFTNDCERWTVIDKKTDNQISFIDKKKLPTQNEYAIVIGVFHIIKPNRLLELILNTRNLSSQNAFYTALEVYYTENGVELKLSEKWIDFGHSDKYFEHKFNVESRDFNEIDINKHEKSLVKRSKHTQKLIQEIDWYLKLPVSLKKYVPSIISYGKDAQNPFIEMEYVNYLTLHEIYIYGNHAIEKWKQIILQLKQVNNELKEYKSKPENSSALLRKIYIDKTLQRLASLKQSQAINFDIPYIINGKPYLSLSEYASRIPEIVEQFGLCNPKDFNVIHGDFFLANILYDLSTDSIKLIDPRGEFGEPGIYGDNLYEWAKLAHSFDGNYDLIVSDKFDLFTNKNNIFYNLHYGNNHNEIVNYFYSTIADKDELLKIKLIQSLLFFSMIPLHYDKTRRQMMMLARAIELFHPFINNKI